MFPQDDLSKLNAILQESNDDLQLAISRVVEGKNLKLSLGHPISD